MPVRSQGLAARRLALAAASVLSLAAWSPALAQGAAEAPQDPTISTRFEAAEADGDMPTIRAFNSYEWRRFSLRWGGGLLYDYSTYSQDDNSKSQMDVSPLDDLRDFRILLKGRIAIPQVTYTLGYMYDKAKDSWRFRQTGIMVDIPKAYGGFFFGRTKEGFSTNKMMVGYQGWTNERSTMNDALVPILADGVKWSGYLPNGKLLYNVGFFRDTRSEIETFNKNDKQTALRTVWLPWAGTDRGVLHIAAQFRHARADDGKLQYRSKPESFQAQDYAIDTGAFAAEYANAFGVETYYRPGPLLFGMEYYVNKAEAPDSGDPLLHGGEVLMAYTLTGETKPYNARGGYFERLSPARSVFEGGPGAWEVVTRFSYSDMDSQSIRGGTFWRLTPMVNWHLSNNVRLELVYGYSSLNRFALVGKHSTFRAASSSSCSSDPAG